MTQPSRKWKQPVLELQQLSPLRKWSKGNCKNGHHAESKFENVTESGSENRFDTKAIGAQQIDEVGESEVEVYVLHAQQRRKENTAIKKSRLLASEDN